VLSGNNFNVDAVLFDYYQHALNSNIDHVDHAAERWTSDPVVSARRVSRMRQSLYSFCNPAGK
jgi:hypothetical protein